MPFENKSPFVRKFKRMRELNLDFFLNNAYLIRYFQTWNHIWQKIRDYTGLNLKEMRVVLALSQT